MSDTVHLKCPRCGKELPVSAPEGLCPACLGALNFATETEMPGAEAGEALPPLTPQELAPHFPQLEILECLGRGGMGVVYKARQRTLNRLVALKLLAPERVQDAKFADRFAREAQALAALNHPNIVTIHDFGKAGGFYYLLMEFVDGLNLRQLLRSRKLQSSEALAIVPPVCEALQYAHEHGIVHRDIKPENLLLAKDGRVKIADFGIAKMLGTDASAASISLSSPKGGEGRGEEAPTASATQQTTMGTPQYMAPEQREQPQNADHRTDIYALGVVLYELLTGELPADKLQPPSKKVQIDVRLDEVVLRALEKTPELRYQTAGEFKTQLESVAVKPSEKNAPEKDIASASPPNRGPLPRPLKAIICWLLVQGGWALSHNLFNFIQWNQVHLNLIGLNLAAGFGLMTLRTGWWRFALVMNGAQMLSLLLEVPLALAPASVWNRFLSPMEAFRTQPAFLTIWVLMQVVTITTCVLVHFNLLRLRREGWFGPVAEEQKKIEYAITTVTFYAGIILGIVIIGLMPFRFSRDAAYLVVVGLMVALSPLVGMFVGNALRQAEQKKQAGQLTRIRSWLDRLSIVAWTLALPVVGFGIFFLFGSLSEIGGWNPATSEAVLIPLTWLGSMLLPWAAICLRSTPVKNVNRVWQIAGLLTLICMTLGLGLRHYESWQKDARRMAAEREATARSLPAKVVRQVESAPFIAQLPDGGHIELHAVRYSNTPENEAWWQPDGSPSIYGGDIQLEGPKQTRQTIMGLVKFVAPTMHQMVKGREGAYEGISFTGGRMPIKNGVRWLSDDLLIVEFERAWGDGKTATLPSFVGVSEWDTLLVLKPGLADYLNGGEARRQWEFSETANGNLRLFSKHFLKQEGLEYSMVAIGKDGKVYTPNISRISTTTGNPWSEYEAAFDSTGSGGGLKPSEVKEVLWRSRKYEMVEFRNVSLKPGHLTKVAVKEFATDPKRNAADTASSSTPNLSANSPAVITPPSAPAPGMIPFASILLLFLLAVIVIGGVVLTIWLSRKKGLKGCLLAGAIMLGVLLGLVGLVLLLSFGYRATKANSFNAPAGTTLDLRPIGLQAPASQPTGLAMQVQNGFNIRASGGQLVTFEFFMRQGDDRLEPLPQLTAKLVTAPDKFFEGSVSWMGKRGDDARNTNQLWFWSVNGYQQGGVPQPSRPDYETNLTYTLRSGEVLNWWQLAQPPQVNLMPGSAPQDIPLFRTFGSATLDSKQPKEAIVRVKCEALPAGYQFGREQYELLLGSKINTFRSVAEGVQTDEFERTVSKEKMTWQKWSKAAVDEARKNGHAVLVDFTADWCLTGQANRKTSIEVKAVREKLDAIGAIALSGDYTKADSAITEELERYKRVGVPLTIIYPANPEAEPIVLPELLTPAAVVEALNKAAQELVGNKP
jgi:serine/threonine protein kinase